MVGALPVESMGQRIGGAIGCAFIAMIVGIPICGIAGQSLSAPGYAVALGIGAFALAGGWLGYRR